MKLKPHQKKTLTKLKVLHLHKNKVMNKVKRGVPKRYRDNLDEAASRRGGVWGNG